MSDQTTPLPGADGGGSATDEAPPAAALPSRTPARPVLSIALLLFVPALLLVMNGNLSVQTALVRFAGALVVSWLLARLVFATVRAYVGAGAGAEHGTKDAAAPGPTATGASAPPAESAD